MSASGLADSALDLYKQSGLGFSEQGGEENANGEFPRFCPSFQ